MPLDPLLAPPLEGTRVVAIGTNDPDAVFADLANPGLSRRPPSPVHPRARRDAAGAILYSWTRRARGQWRWPDSVDVPLVEEREAYEAGYGPVEAPWATWLREEPSLNLSAGERAALLAAHGPGCLWVRQIGTFDRSAPLALTSLS